ncbi:MAG: tetratricopeptide repeat protein, partial [Planctomycetota bacterium]
MRGLLIFLAGAAVDAGLLLGLGPRGAGESRSARGAVDRARAWFLNESNPDYRRARLELLGVEDELGGLAAYHLDLALIDLGEYYHRVQGRFDVLPGPARHRVLLRSALEQLERASALAPGDEAVHYNLARTLARLAEGSARYEELMRQAEGLLDPLLAGDRPDPAALFLKGRIRYELGDYEAARQLWERV